MEYRREIDGLRTLAVLPVLLFHAGVPGFSGGFVGVDVFFVISGYLITSILLAELGQDRFTLLAFYERRVRRIFPALFLVMAASLPMAWIWLAPSDLQDFGKSLISVALFGSNFFFWKQSGYFDTAAELKPMLHTWSLSVEEQYYLLFPLLLLLGWRYCRRHLSLLLGVLALLSLAWAEASNSRAPAGAFFLLPARGWELLAGAIAALHGDKLRDRSSLLPRIDEVLSTAGLLLIVGAVVGLDHDTPFPGVYALLPVCGTVAILLHANARNAVGRLLGCKLTVGIGLLSYSAYLWHQPIFAFARHASSTGLHWTVFLGMGLLSLGLAFLSWRYVERPFRSKGFLTRRQVFSSAAAGSLIFILIGIGAQAANSLTKYRVGNVQQGWFDTAQRSPMRESCHNMGKTQLSPKEACEYFGQNTDWAVLGDSHAVELAYALAELKKANATGIKHFSSSSCSPSLDDSSSDAVCAAWTRSAIDELERRPEIKVVVLSYRINKYLWGEHEKTYPVLPRQGSEASRAALWNAYVGLIDRLQAGGKRVVVVLQAPELGRRITDLIFQAGRVDGEVIGVAAKWWQLRNSYVYERLNTFPVDVTVVDPAQLFCDKINCYVTQGGKSLYFDDDHMSAAGAMVVARSILSLD